MTLSILAPIAITDATLISSTALENDYAPWSAATTYAVAGYCISVITHRIYKSARAGNIGNDPTLIANLSGDTPWWVDAGPTNARAMFDGIVSTQTTVASPLTVVLRPGFFNSIYLGGLDAETMSLTVKDAPGGNVIFSHSALLEGSSPADYYEYFYEPFRPQKDFLSDEITPCSTAEVTLTLTRASGLVKVGIMALGDCRPLGRSQYGIKVKPKSYSYIDIDKFGALAITRRKSATDMSATAWLKLVDADYVCETLASLLDVPCVIIGADLKHYASTRVFGLINGEVSYDYPQDCLLTIDAKGLI